ncbi:glycosyltransferase family 1 protein [Candidatus Parcubacteria bacterium]|nr:MAG: glycosyltransferase family 1 protein [Candidatus Parcubacteria bacterium]
MEGERAIVGRLLFLVNEDRYFCSHRLHLAIAAKERGMDVYVATRVDRHGEQIEKAGIKLIPIDFRRGSLSLGKNLKLLKTLVGVYRQVRPDIVHHVSLQLVIYGGLAARIAGVSRVVNALTGMGFVFSSSSRKAALLRPWVRLALRYLLTGKGDYIIVQNIDDFAFITQTFGIDSERVALIRGAGVNPVQFSALPFPEPPPVVVSLVGRMVEDKGVREFVEAVRLLKEKGLPIKGILVGDEDPENPVHISRERLLAWHREGIVEWWGPREDIPEVWAQSHIAVLPSYREGLPKALLEAAACARPIVATDVPGCREIVRDGENGFLVHPKDAHDLARALKKLVEDEMLRETMGAHARRMVEQEFSDARVQQETMALYARMLAE